MSPSCCFNANSNSSCWAPVSLMSPPTSFTSDSSAITTGIYNTFATRHSILYISYLHLLRSRHPLLCRNPIGKGILILLWLQAWPSFSILYSRTASFLFKQCRNFCWKWRYYCCFYSPWIWNWRPPPTGNVKWNDQIGKYKNVQMELTKLGVNYHNKLYKHTKCVNETIKICY